MHGSFGGIGRSGRSVPERVLDVSTVFKTTYGSKTEKVGKDCGITWSFNLADLAYDSGSGIAAGLDSTALDESSNLGNGQPIGCATASWGFVSS